MLNFSMTLTVSYRKKFWRPRKKKTINLKSKMQNSPTLTPFLHVEVINLHSFLSANSANEISRQFHVSRNRAGQRRIATSLTHTYDASVSTQIICKSRGEQIQGPRNSSGFRRLRCRTGIPTNRPLLDGRN